LQLREKLSGVNAGEMGTGLVKDFVDAFGTGGRSVF
jgi:hypothetical protein